MSKIIITPDATKTIKSLTKKVFEINVLMEKLNSQIKPEKEITPEQAMNQFMKD
jgi:hypothetical protein